MNPAKEATSEEILALIGILKVRFEKNKNLHQGLEWGSVAAKLHSHLLGKGGNIKKLRSLHQMETTGGEPDVIGFDPHTDEFIFCDCSAESPKGRRSICYDREGLESRKDFPPANNAVDIAKKWELTS
jgi:hypothetical protein